MSDVDYSSMEDEEEARNGSENEEVESNVEDEEVEEADEGDGSEGEGGEEEEEEEAAASPEKLASSPALKKTKTKRAAAPASKPKKTKAATPSSTAMKEKEGSTHPKYEEMIIVAIAELKSRSVEIFLYILKIKMTPPSSDPVPPNLPF